jgi:putative sigma-54 modulation protein
MQFKISTREIDLTDGLKEYIDKRLGRLDRYSPRILDGELVFYEERGRFVGELIIKVKGATLKAEAKAKDPFETVDLLKDKMKGQLKKYEEKLKDRRIKGTEAQGKRTL